MRLQRLFRMGPAEIAFRIGQEVSKPLERGAAWVREVGKRPPRLFEHLRRGAGLDAALDLYASGQAERAADEALRYFRARGAAHMFAGACQDAVPSVIDRLCGAERERVLESADAICGHAFDILGHGRLDFGSPPDWCLDPVSGRRSPEVHWSRIDYLDREQVGDSKVVWELNRHQWMLDLGQAWRFSGREQYAQACVRLARDWMRHNPPGRGINWSSSLEVAMRLMSWSWALFLLRDSRSLSPALFVEMLAWLRLHANHVENHLSHYFSPNTHLTGEALGLYYAGCLWPELRDAVRWRERGERILGEQLRRQVHPDGVYFEQSTCYQYYTVEIYLHFLLLARRNGLLVPEQLEKRLEDMLDFLLALRRPDGSLPQIGDADGGWLLPLVRRAPGDFNGLFATAAVLFGRADFAWAAGSLAPETCWLLGADSAQAFQALRPQPPARSQPRIFRQGGYAVLRSGWDSQAHQLIFDTGPVGAYGHGHADMLSIQCSAFGETFLVDPGTGCYTADAAWRDHFRGSAAHNTLTLDGRSQLRSNGPFSWHAGETSARLRYWETAPGHELVEAAHQAYSEGGNVLTHRRRVVFVKPHFWLLVDDVEGKGVHELNLNFQFAPLELALEAGGWARARGRKAALLLRSFAAAPLRNELSLGCMQPRRGWISPNYGQREAAPALTCNARAELPLRLLTLLLPLPERDAPPPRVEYAREEVAHGTLETLSVDGKRIRIQEHRVAIESRAMRDVDKRQEYEN